MINFNKLRVSTKIIIPIIVILTIGSIISNYVSSVKMNTLAKHSAKESLSMLTDSIFITLRNAMNTGDPILIKQAEDDSRKNIQGLKNLTVAKSKETIEMYTPNAKFTTDKIILKSFKTKKEQVLDVYKNKSHSLRVLRPMIATNDCLMCHANHKKGDVIGVIDLTFSLDQSDKMINNTIIFIVTISIVLILLTIIVTWFITKKATNPLKELKSEIAIFFSFLANERDSMEPFKVHSMDEIGEMISVLNENIDKTIKGMKKDTETIKISSMICEKASLGYLDVQIDATANNPEINKLTDIVNNLLSSFNYNINRLLNILDSYANETYDKRINSKGKTSGEIKKIFDHVDFLGDTLSKISTQNLQNGLALQQTSQVFSQNVKSLATSSQLQVESLNQTSNALLEVTQNIQNTTSDSKEMANYAEKVNISSEHGQILAKRTAESMIDINEKVDAINEATSVIDQIAFQTNILSLNAAVEAATAGEAGKGFAVVAQEVRNLASRSAEAAKEIKELVESAAIQAQSGKNIADEMIKGYEELNQNISETTKLIDSVAHASNIQKEKIEQINEAISDIDKATQENANVAEETNIVAQQASDISQKIVDDAQAKTFDGKTDIKIRTKITNPNFKGVEKRKIEKNIKNKLI